MDSKLKLPFLHLSAEAWQNLAIAALVVYYVAQVLFDIAAANVFGNLESDFASFWSAGYVANHWGYASVYDLDAMARVQEPLLPEVANSGFVFHANPTPYLPVFIIPFQLLALLPPTLAAAAWTLLNFAGTILYLRFFAQRIAPSVPHRRLILLLMLSAPVFENLLTGQVNLFLMISAGEYLRASLDGRPLVSGLWLGGLLIKPQCLILIAPALLINRSFRTLVGLAASSAAILGVSILLGGTRSMGLLGQLWLGYAAGLPTNVPQLMMNWRMIAIRLAAIMSQPVAWGIAIAGALVTSLAALRVWAQRARLTSSQLVIAVTATFAATGLVAWHSHVHMAMLLIPALMALYLTQRPVIGAMLELWCFIPAGLFLARLVLAAMMRAGILPAGTNSVLELLTGVGLFTLNLYILIWGSSRLHRRGTREAQPLPA